MKASDAKGDVGKRVVQLLAGAAIFTVGSWATHRLLRKYFPSANEKMADAAARKALPASDDAEQYDFADDFADPDFAEPDFDIDMSDPDDWERD